jgi:hypothetical protein
MNNTAGKLCCISLHGAPCLTASSIEAIMQRAPHKVRLGVSSLVPVCPTESVITLPLLLLVSL